MKFAMIHADEWSETHFGVQDIPERELPVGPPPNPAGQMSDLGAVATMCLIAFHAGTEAPAHNAPQPYVCVILSGEGEVVSSDGESRRFHAGDLLYDVPNQNIGRCHHRSQVQRESPVAQRQVVVHRHP
jgi:hypothetical protein